MNSKQPDSEFLFAVKIRPATNEDVSVIVHLLENYSEKGLLLPPTKQDIASRISTFIVAIHEGRTIGCASLRDYDNNLFEVRSLAVDAEYTGKRIGSMLVSYLLAEFDIPEGSRVFALTYRASFFQRQGFNLVSKELFPEKIWNDCDKCPKKDNCDELAVMKNI